MNHKENDPKYIETLASQNEIQTCLNCTRVTCPGYCIAVDDLKPTPKARPSRKILCIDTGKLYATIAEAAAVSGTSESSLYYCLRGKSKTCGGLRWEWAADKSTMRHRVECVDTGERFVTVVDAAKSAGVHPNSMHAHLRGLTKTCGGYQWKLIDKEKE